MTTVDVCYRYGIPPEGTAMVALAKVRDVYGIRKISFEGKDVVRVEFDATRLTDEIVLGMLRGAGLDIREKLALV